MMLPLIFSGVFLIIIWGHSPVEGVTPDHKNHLITYSQEFEAFERELLMSEDPDVTLGNHHRSKRFIYLNTDTFVAAAVLVGVPFSLVLPSLGNLYHKWRRLRKRDVQDEEVLEEDWSHLDPAVQSELEKISTYFQLVDIPETSCQLLAICSFSAKPERFYPLSEMILSRIRNPKLPPLIYQEDKDKASKGPSSNATLNLDKKPDLFQLYNDVANIGLYEGVESCEKRYHHHQGNNNNDALKCPYPLENLLNMPTLRFWSAMQRFLKLRFTEGDVTF